MAVLDAGGEWHLVVGGGSANRYVVYMTFDNMSFLNLLSRDKADQTVTLFVGGQDSLFPDNAVVSRCAPRKHLRRPGRRTHRASGCRRKIESFGAAPRAE